MSMISQPIPMTSVNQLRPMGSPFYINTAQVIGNTYNQARLRLWVWTGSYTSATNRDPDYTLVKDRVSASDVTIVFELSELIKPHIKPQINAIGSRLNGAVWFYYEIVYLDTTTVIPTIIRTDQSLLQLATLGYSWNYEQQSALNGAFLADGTTDTRFAIDNIDSMPLYSYVGGVTYWSNKIANIGATTSTGVFGNDNYTPTDVVCPKEAYVIVFLNKVGLYEQLTTTGKVVVSNAITTERYRRTARNPLAFRNSVHHQENTFNIDSMTTVKINTGLLHPVLVNKIEEIAVSPSIYIISVGSGQRTAVTLDNFTFDRKTIINDKSKISYTLTFKETTNKVRSII